MEMVLEDTPIPSMPSDLDSTETLDSDGDGFR